MYLLQHIAVDRNGRHFASNLFRCILLNKNFDILIQISPTFVLEDPIDNRPALVHVMAGTQQDTEPLPESALWCHMALLDHWESKQMPSSNTNSSVKNLDNLSCPRAVKICSVL